MQSTPSDMNAFANSYVQFSMILEEFARAAWRGDANINREYNNGFEYKSLGEQRRERHAGSFKNHNFHNNEYCGKPSLDKRLKK